MNSDEAKPAVPPDLQAGNGSLSVSTRHTKDRSWSIRWDWEGGDALEQSGLDLSPSQHTQAGMEGWIYCEQPVDGRLTFQLGPASGEPAYTFRFGLGFTGWRAFRIQFLVDAVPAGTLSAPANIQRMRIVPPNTAGTVFLDTLTVSESVSSQRSADFQVPEFSGELGSWWSHWPLHYSRQEPSEALPGEVGPEQARDFATIAARYEAWLLGGAAELREPLRSMAERQLGEYVDLGWKAFRGLSLKRDEGGWISGPALHMRKGTNTFHHVFYNVLLPLVFDYKRNGRREALDAALLTLDYVHDQGWAEGSANLSMLLNGLVFAPYCHTIYLLRDELRETGRFDPAWRTALWYLSFGKSFSRFREAYIETNADELRSTVFTSLVMVLAMGEGPRKVQYMRGWLSWLNCGLEISPRFTGLIKPDGLGFHHHGVYAGAYATEAYEFCSLAAYLLHGTSFALLPSSMCNLKLALRTQDALTQKYDVPYTTMGRMPHPGVRIVSAYAWAALTSEPPDPEMAGIFMRLWDPGCSYLDRTLAVDLDGAGGKFLCKQTPGRLERMQDLADRDLPASPPPEGFWSKPWGALAIHRRDNWLAAVKGWSQYVWDFERHPKLWAVNEENVFARMWSYGTLQLLTHGDPVNPVDSGWALDRGWDWCRWPGATTPHLSLQELYDPATSWEGRFFSDATFVGGVSSGGRNGLFALTIHEHYHDPTFRAFKTTFFFDNEIVCLGSNIESRIASRPTETTLFQCHMPDESMPVQVNGDPVTSFPGSFEGTAGEPVALMDPYGNGYLVPDGATLRLERGVQRSRDAWNRGDTEGAFSTCWFDHGHAPRDDGYGAVRYHYALLVQTSPDALQAYAEAPPYTVLQQNHQAHILYHAGLRATGYALFETDWIIPHGPVRRTDTPVLVMAEEREDGLLLSLADPDLRLPKRRNMAYLDDEANRTPARPSTVRLELRGAWQAAAPHPDVRVESARDGVTALTFSCNYGLTVELLLQPS